MSLRLVDVRLDVLTTGGRLGYTAAFSDGLNVLAAPNSYGKSTLFQAIVFALGLEGMLTRSHALPLGPIMTTVADLPDRTRAAVVESSVTLTCASPTGGYLRARRFARSSDVESRLVQTWSAADEAGLDTAARVDTYVWMGGAAVQELGFHRLLADFMGWHLPQVPTYGTKEVPLYLEALFPLFYVEQKSGWAGVAPRMPTYLGIRDMLRRAVEYVLGLSTLDRLRALIAVREEIAELRATWIATVARAEAGAAAQNLRLNFQSPSITGSSQRRPMLLEVIHQGAWAPVTTVRAAWEQRLRELEGASVPTAGARTDQSRQDLHDAELEVRRIGAQARTYAEQAEYVRADLDALTSRVAAVDADRRRLQDLRRVRALGSDLGLATVSDDLCPTCRQPLDERHVATGEVASLEVTLALGDAERTTLLDMRAAAEARLSDLERARDAATLQLADARQRVRLLRDELTSRSAVPSLVEVHEQVRLRDLLEATNRVQVLIETTDEELNGLADRYDDARARLRALEEAADSEDDNRALSDFSQRFSEQLAEYGLISLPAAQVTIDPNSMIPVDDGVELRFDIGLGMSASDTIRTKWAYYVALLETALARPNGHHAGLLMLDEPRQQETAKLSLAALVRRLGVAASSGAQILYATSEDPADLSAVLAQVTHHRLPADGGHLLAPL